MIHDWLRRWALDSSGFNGPLAQAMTNWSPEFIARMRARMVGGFFRYGCSSIRDPNHRRYDNVGAAIEQLKRYRQDGNKERLVDAANLCLCEDVTESCHPSPSFRSIDDGEHTEEIACRKRGHSSGWIRKAKRRAVYARDRHRCVYCNRSVPESERTLDHVRARSNGGSNAASNLVTACLGCNSSKQGKPLRQWCSEVGFDVGAIRRRIKNAVRRKLRSET